MHKPRLYVLLTSAMLIMILALSVGPVSGQTGIRDRSQIEDKYKWDLSHIYPDWAAWDKGMADLERKMDEFAGLKGTLAAGPENLLKAYTLNDELSTLAARVFRFPEFQFALNARDNEAATRLQRVQTAFARFATATAWLTPEMLAIGWDTVSPWLVQSPGLAPYRFPITDTYRKQKHVLSEDKERLLSYYSLLSASPFQAYTALATADIKFRDLTLPDGRTVTMTPGNYRNLLTNDSSQADRAAAFATFYSTYSDNANSFAAIYNGVLQADWGNAQARNYPTCLEAGLDGYNVPVPVVENLIASVKRGLAPLQRYHRIRREALGLPAYHRYDGSYPLIDFHKTYEYDDIVPWLIESVAPLGEAYQATVKEAFANRWVDVYETANKNPGAFSGNCYGVHPYILMNWNKTLEHVFILAHEMGHTMHSVLADAAQPLATSQYTLLGAEVASAVNEGLLMDYLMKRSKDPQERIALLVQAIDKIEGTYYTQVQFAEFEVEAHRMVERGEPITAESLTDLCTRIAREYDGDEVVTDSLYGYIWAR
ncbi:MAG: oligoendopeptidase F family protein, partial [candidate division Zixibacteria bacterium]|nr:oligoendopeptidase F family protein [candidate division Zixibacteria bacterium]